MMLNREFQKPGLIPLSALSDWISAETQSQWLAFQLRRFLGTEGRLSQDEIQKALAGLAQKDLIATKGGAYLPSAAVDRLAERFVVLDGAITARSVQVDKKDKPLAYIFQIIKSSFTDLLLWDATGKDTLRMLAISPSSAVQLLATFLMDATVQEDVAALSLRSCPQCAVQLPEKSRFCPECGAKLDAQEATAAKPPQPAVIAKCTKCGTALEPGSKFCLSCGTKAGASDKPSMQAAPVFCANCGAKAAPGEKFCASCGKAL
jgi:RNA polymerase subunit RPABC4/transcription elongation factor Spt4